ncbi:MAG: hypothetical protein ABFD24_12005 [Anaerolineaceae bacterium]
MRTIDPKLLMIIGAALMVLGVVLPLLILIKILESTFFLNFLSYIFQITGLILAMIGLVSYAGIRKR